MKTKIALSIFFLGFILSACSGGGKEATLVLYFGGSSVPNPNIYSASVLTNWPPADNIELASLNYEITLSGSSGKRTERASGLGPVILTVAPGRWVIEVTAYSGAEEYAYGITETVARSGQNDIQITLRRAGGYIIRINVTPESVSVYKGGGCTFAATTHYGNLVSSADKIHNSYNWTVSGNRSNLTSITSAGVLTVGLDETASTLTIRAASAAPIPNSIFGIAIVTVNVSVNALQSTLTINSNSLLDIPGAKYGWYAKTSNGLWLSGQMKLIGQERQLSISISGVNVPYSTLPNNTFGTMTGSLGEDIGSYSMAYMRTGGNNVCYGINTQIYIPHDSLDVYLQIQDTTTKIYKGNNLTHLCSVTGSTPGDPANCWYLSGAGGATGILLKVDVKAYTTREFLGVDKSAAWVDGPSPYPVLQLGEIYYWQKHNCGVSSVPACVPGTIIVGGNSVTCVRKGGDHVHDFWSIANETVSIIDFPTTGINYGTGTPPIMMRAWNPSELGVAFVEASTNYLTANGSNELYIEVPLLNGSHYGSPISYDLIVDSVKVGEVKVRIIDHVQNTTTLILSRVTLEVEYVLDPGFVGAVEKIYCGGVEVPGTNKVTIERNHGPITLSTEFILK